MKKGSYIITDAIINRYGKLSMKIQLNKLGTDNYEVYEASSRLMLMTNKNYDVAKQNLIYNAKIRYNLEKKYKYDSPIQYIVLSEGIVYESNKGLKIRRSTKNYDTVFVYERKTETMKEQNIKIKKAQKKFLKNNNVSDKDKKAIKKAIAYGFRSAGKRSVLKKIKTVNEHKTSKKKFRETFMTEQEDFRKLTKKERLKYRKMPKEERHDYVEKVSKKPKRKRK